MKSTGVISGQMVYLVCCLTDSLFTGMASISSRVHGALGATFLFRFSTGRLCVDV